MWFYALPLPIFFTINRSWRLNLPHINPYRGLGDRRTTRIQSMRFIDLSNIGAMLLHAPRGRGTDFPVSGRRHGRARGRRRTAFHAEVRTGARAETPCVMVIGPQAR